MVLKLQGMVKIEIDECEVKDEIGDTEKGDERFCNVTDLADTKSGSSEPFPYPVPQVFVKVEEKIEEISSEVVIKQEEDIDTNLNDDPQDDFNQSVSVGDEENNVQTGSSESCSSSVCSQSQTDTASSNNVNRISVPTSSETP